MPVGVKKTHGYRKYVRDGRCRLDVGMISSRSFPSRFIALVLKTCESIKDNFGILRRETAH